MEYHRPSEEYDKVLEAIRQQKEYCKRHSLPHFAPLDGICYKCHRQIYSGPAAISAEQAATSLVTGCPYCRRSYVD